MKLAKVIEAHEIDIGFVAMLPSFAAGFWAMWQERLVGATGGYSATKLQPIAVGFKGGTRFLSQAAANSYHLSQSLFYAGLLYVCCIAFIWVLVTRTCGRSKA